MSPKLRMDTTILRWFSGLGLTLRGFSGPKRSWTGGRRRAWHTSCQGTLCDGRPDHSGPADDDGRRSALQLITKKTRGASRPAAQVGITACAVPADVLCFEGHGTFTAAARHPFLFINSIVPDRPGHRGRRSVMRQKRATPAGAADSRARSTECPNWLVDAVSKPGAISTAYSGSGIIPSAIQFSPLAMLQRIDPGPIHTFVGGKAWAVTSGKGRRRSRSASGHRIAIDAKDSTPPHPRRRRGPSGEVTGPAHRPGERGLRIRDDLCLQAAPGSFCPD